jgi:hypothetical protein
MTEKKKNFGERLKEARKKRLAKQFHGDYLSEMDKFSEAFVRGSKKADSVIRDYRPTEKYKGKIKNYAQPRKSNHEEGVQRSLRDLKLYGKFREIGEKEA